MTDERKDLPPVTAPNFLEKVREALGVYLGNRGDKLDRGLTLRDLADAGIVDVSPRYLSGGGKTSPIGGVGVAVTSAYEADLTPPPTPSGFTASAAISNLVLNCGSATYTQGHGHAKSRLYGATWTSGDLPVFAAAVRLTEFSGTVGSYATNPATTWRLWLTWVTVDGAESPVPAGGTNGLAVTTGQDVSTLLTALSGGITSSQLATSLSTPISLITADASVSGSVNQRLAAETAARVAAVGVEASDRATAVLNEAAARALDVGDLQTQLDTIVAVTGGDLSTVIAAVQEEQTSRATAVAAEAAARETLATQIRGGYTGTDVSVLASGLIFNEKTARTTADLAQVSRLDTLEATVNNAATGVVATSTALDAVELTVNNATTGVAASATRLSNLETTVNTGANSNTELRSTITSEATTRASADTALASRATALEASVNSVTTGLPTKASVAYVDTAKADAISSAAATTATVQAQLDTGGATQLAIAAAQTTANAAVTNAATAQTTANTAVSTANAAASNITTVQARLDTGDYAAVKTESNSTTTRAGLLEAKYTVKLDVNGYVSGFGLASTSNGATPYSQFIFKADQFAFGAPGVATAYPFVIQASPTTVNGVAVPAGVYMNGAYIENGTITNAKIGNLAVDDAKIASLSAAKLTAGTIDTGDITSTATTVIDSVVYPSFAINASTGLATFNNVVVRGTVYATAGQIGGNTIDATSIHSGATGYGTGAGFYLGSDGAFSLGDKLTWNGAALTINGSGTFSGALSAATGTFSGALSAATGSFAGELSAATGSFAGSLSAATGSFSGSLSAATGTFSGSLTADAIAVVNTINIAGNAVTINATSSGTVRNVTASVTIPAGVTARVTGIFSCDGFTNVVNAGYTFTATLNGISKSKLVYGGIQTGGGDSNPVYSSAGTVIVNSVVVTGPIVVYGIGDSYYTSNTTVILLSNLR